jgi:hypothetical protein
MPRPTPSPKPSQFANEGEVNATDAAILETPFGHDDDQGAQPGSVAEEEVRRPLGGQPRSEVTGARDDGAGANETEDGLDGYAEAARENAEDVAPGNGQADIPVFDRGDMIEKI